MILWSLAQLVMFEQILFSLPWSLAAIWLAWPYAPDGANLRLVLALVALVCARTAGMGLNRWIDMHIDLANPRTAQRPLQLGHVKLSQVKGLSVISLALLILIAAYLGPAFLLLCPFVVAVITAYSFTKRFTWCCHFVLGLIHALGPILSYSAVSLDWCLSVFWLGLSAGLAISSADILYALQDLVHDRKVGLYSIPACFGRLVAKRISVGLYALSALSLAAVGITQRLAPFFWFAWVIFALWPVLFYKYINDGQIAQGFFRCSALLPLWALIGILLGSVGK